MLKKLRVTLCDAKEHSRKFITFPVLWKFNKKKSFAFSFLHGYTHIQPPYSLSLSRHPLSHTHKLLTFLFHHQFCLKFRFAWKDIGKTLLRSLKASEGRAFQQKPYHKSLLGHLQDSALKFWAPGGGEFTRLCSYNPHPYYTYLQFRFMFECSLALSVQYTLSIILLKLHKFMISLTHSHNITMESDLWPTCSLPS